MLASGKIEVYVYRTFRKECPMHIALRINMDGQYLEVTSVCYDHNHPISQVGYLSAGVSM